MRWRRHQRLIPQTCFWSIWHHQTPWQKWHGYLFMKFGVNYCNLHKLYVTPTCTFPSCGTWRHQSTSLSPTCPRVILVGDVCSLYDEHELPLWPQICQKTQINTVLHEPQKFGLVSNPRWLITLFSMVLDNIFASEKLPKLIIKVHKNIW